MTTGELLISFFTILAILTGPYLAIIVARKNDERRAEKQRKLDIFRALMKTRGLTIHQDHVEALNLVGVDFIGCGGVVQTWKEYLQELGNVLPSEETDQYKKAIQKRISLLTKLIYEMAKTLDIEIEALDILEDNYIPQGWIDDDWDQRLVRKGLMNVVFGRSPILVKSPQSQQTMSPYPPTPPQDHDL